LNLYFGKDVIITPNSLQTSQDSKEHSQ